MRDPWKKQTIRSLARLLLPVLLVLCLAGPALSAITAGYTWFYIPGPTNDILSIFDHIDENNAGGDYLDETQGLVSVINIVASGDSTTVYYDHHEDGFDLDEDNPESTYDEKYTLDAGDVLTFQENSNDWNPTVKHDGGDRIFVVGPSVSVSRAAWPGMEWSGPSLALDWEVYPVKPFLTDYTIPVGEDLYDSGAHPEYRDFELVYALIMSVADDNIVQVDDPENAGVELTVTLQKGETIVYGGNLYGKSPAYVPSYPDPYRSDSLTDTVNAGIHFKGTKPIQVQFVAATTRGKYECRGFNVVPDSLWDNEYYNPVTSTGTANTDLFIYNPNQSAMLIEYRDSQGSGSFAIPARSTQSYYLGTADAEGTGRYVPTDSGVYLKSDSIFWGIGAADTNSTTYDWGYTLIPQSFLTDQYYIGWAPGCSTLYRCLNGSPVYVAAVYDGTKVYVDYNNDNTTFDQAFTLDSLEGAKLRDSDYVPYDLDNTGMEIWTDGLPLVVVWGEDPAVAGDSSPYLDLGASTLPMPADWMDLVLGIDVSVNPGVLPPASGELVQFTLAVSTYDFPVSSISVENILPTDFVYVPYDSGNPTQSGAVITLPDGTTQITGASADPSGASGSTLTWTNAILQSLDMGADETLTITFWAQSDALLDLSTIYTDKAQASGSRLEGTHVFSPFDYAAINVAVLTIDKDQVNSAQVQAGGTAVYTIRLANIATDSATDVTVTDTLPKGFTYDAMITTNGGIGGAPATTTGADGRQTLTWDSSDIGSIASGAEVLIEFQVDVAADAAPGTYDNNAQVTFDYNDGTTAYNDLAVDDLGDVAQDAGTPADEDPETDEDVTVMSLTIDKETSTTVVAAGETASFQVILENQGAADVTGLILTDNMPDGFSYDTGTACIWVGTGETYENWVEDPEANPLPCTYTTAPTIDGQELTWNLETIIGGGLPADYKVVVSYDTTVAVDTAPGTYSSTALAYSDQTGWIDDSGSAGWKPDEVPTCTDTIYDQHTPACDEAYDEDVEVRAPVLTIDLDTTTPMAVNAPGTADDTNAVYTISVVNDGTATATGVVISQDLPSGGDWWDPWEFTWAQNVSITLTDATGPTTVTPTNTSGTTWLWDGGWSIAPGGSVVITFEANVDGADAGTYDSTAYANFANNPSGSPIDDIGTDDQDADTPATEDPEEDEDVTIVTTPTLDLGVSITHSGVFAVDEQGTFLIDVVNNGPSDIDSGNGVVVTVTLPTGMTYVSGSLTGTGWVETDGTGQTLTFTYDGGLAAGDALDQLTIGVIPSDATNYTVSAAVDNEYNVDDSNSDNDSDTDAVTVTVLAVAKQALTAEPWYPGDTVTYQVTVTNNSSDIITNLTVSDTLPAGMTYVAGSTVVNVPARQWSYLDRFDSRSYSNNDGTVNWSTSWTEIGEGDGPTRGDEIVTDDGSEVYVVRVQDNQNGGEGVARQADLSGAVTATLSFDYRRNGLDSSSDYVALSFSSDGGATSDEIARFQGPDNDASYVSASYDLTSYISSQTRIAFRSSSTNGNNDRVYFDNVQILATSPARTLANASGAAEPLDDGTPTGLVTTADTVILDPGRTLTVTFNVTIDADTEPGSVTNTAAVTADGLGTDNVSVTNKVRSLPTATFLDGDGNPLSGDEEDYSGDILVRVTDPDKNTDPESIDSITVTITSNGSGDDPITVTLYETGLDTGVFANDADGEPYAIPMYACDPPKLEKDGGCVADEVGELLPDDDEALYVPAGTDPDLTVTYVDTEGSAADQTAASVSLATWAMISDFSACTDGDNVVVQWSTSTQVGTLAFYLLRQDEAGGEFQKVVDHPLPAVLQAPMGADYRFVDTGAVPGKTYQYKLKEIDAFGRNNTYGPYEVTASGTCEAPLTSASGYSAVARTKTPEPVTMMRAFSSFSTLMTTFGATMTAGGEIKITISRPGLYYVSAADIAAGLTDVADETAAKALIAQGGLVLTCQGDAVAWTAADDGAGIYFYGTGVDTRYTKNNAYWLKTGAGLVMKTADAPADVNGLGGADLEDARQALKAMVNLRPGGVRSDYGASADVNANARVDAGEALYALQAASGLRPATGPNPAQSGLTYPYTVRGEEDLINEAGYIDDLDEAIWYWKEFQLHYIYANPVSDSVTIQTDGVSSEGTATLRVGLYGVGELLEYTDMEHHVRAYINVKDEAHKVDGEAEWAGTGSKQLVSTFPASWLNDGDNTIFIEGVIDAGIYYSIFALDYVEITYPRLYKAASDALILSAADHDPVTTEGFSGEDIRVFNITDPLNPGIVMGKTINGATGDFSVSFNTAPGSGDYLAAFPDSQISGVDWAPDDMDGIIRSDLTDTTNSVDYLVIAPSSMKTQAQALADYRASEDGGELGAKVALVEDIYNEFNHGILSPEAIRTFLSFAWRYWEKAPTYVVLVGRGTYDWDGDTLSPMPMETADGLFASDNWFADVAGDDGVPEMAIGRLPVTSDAELGSLLTKIKDYEKSENDGDWNKRVLMVADTPDTGGDFESDTNAVAALVPSPYSASLQKIFVAGNETPRTDLLSALNSGSLLFNYLGHGNTYFLSNSKILSVNPGEADDVSTLDQPNQGSGGPGPDLPDQPVRSCGIRPCSGRAASYPRRWRGHCRLGPHGPFPEHQCGPAQQVFCPWAVSVQFQAPGRCGETGLEKLCLGHR